MDEGDRDRDYQVLEHLDENYSCKICNGVLMSAKQVDCGHLYCSYCLDLLQSMTQNCPQCGSPIISSINIPDVDLEIEKLMQSCSSSLQHQHELYRQNRDKSCRERSKTIQNFKNLLPRGALSLKSARNIDDVCSNLTISISNTPALEHGTTSSIKSSRHHQNADSSYINSNNSRTPRNASRSRPKARSRTGLQRNEIRHSLAGAAVQKPTIEVAGIDLHKVESLFNIYDDFLKTEPGTGASGDLSRENPEKINRSVVVPIQNDPFENDSEEMKALKQKHRQEIDILLNEAEGAVELDEFVQKWSNEIRNVANGEKDEEIESEAITTMMVHLPSGMTPDCSDLDSFEDFSNDEMWKSSADLIRKFREIQDSVQQPSRRVTAEEIDRDFADLEQLTTPRGGDNWSIMTTEFDEEFEKLTLENKDKPLVSSRRKNNKDSNGSKSSRRSDPSELSNAAVSNTFAFWTKIRKCKDALKQLKDTSITTPATIRGLLETQECNTSRIASNTNSGKTTSDLSSTPRTVRLPAIGDPAKTPRNRPRSRPSPLSSRISLPPISTPNTSRSRSRPNATTFRHRNPFQY